MYFLVKDRRFGLDKYVFTLSDPRSDGYPDVVVNDHDVDLDYDMMEVMRWPDGKERPNPQLGRDSRNEKKYKVFKYPEELREADYELVQSGHPIVVPSWRDYLEQYYPVPQEFAGKMTQDEWFTFLDEVDAAAAAKIRKNLSEPDDPKPGSSRDEIAAWVARQHMGADGAVHHIWYLPSDSAEDEIRLLEVSDRFPPEGVPVKPTQVHADIAGTKFRLRIADVTSSQIERIQQNPLKVLPPGWSLEGKKIWSRRNLP